MKIKKIIIIEIIMIIKMIIKMKIGKGNKYIRIKFNSLINMFNREVLEYLGV